jgi:hypothetical protein
LFRANDRAPILLTPALRRGALSAIRRLRRALSAADTPAPDACTPRNPRATHATAYIGITAQRNLAALERGLS